MFELDAERQSDSKQDNIRKKKRRNIQQAR